MKINKNDYKNMIYFIKNIERIKRKNYNTIQNETIINKKYDNNLKIVLTFTIYDDIVSIVNDYKSRGGLGHWRAVERRKERI